MTLTLRNEADTLALGRRLAQACPAAAVIYLRGPLGAGKTTLVRGLLKGIGYRGPVKSPTYTLIEPYECGGRRFFHLDLYRITDPAELEYLGLRELQEGEAVLLVEWPERGSGSLPPADLTLDIEYRPPGRCVHLQPHNDVGVALAAAVGDFSRP